MDGADDELDDDHQPNQTQAQRRPVEQTAQFAGAHARHSVRHRDAMVGKALEVGHASRLAAAPGRPARADVRNRERPLRALDSGHLEAQLTPERIAESGRVVVR